MKMKKQLDAFLESGVTAEKPLIKSIYMYYRGPQFRYYGNHGRPVDVTSDSKILVRISQDNKFQVNDTEVIMFKGDLNASSGNEIISCNPNYFYLEFNSIQNAITITAIKDDKIIQSWNGSITTWQKLDLSPGVGAYQDNTFEDIPMLSDMAFYYSYDSDTYTIRYDDEVHVGISRGGNRFAVHDTRGLILKGSFLKDTQTGSEILDFAPADFRMTIQKDTTGKYNTLIISGKKEGRSVPKIWAGSINDMHITKFCRVSTNQIKQSTYSSSLWPNPIMTPVPTGRKYE